MKIKSFWGQLFCKHDYDEFARKEYRCAWARKPVLDIVYQCPHCGKVVTIQY